MESQPAINALWTPWDDDSTQSVTLRWENNGWTVEGIVERESVHYVLRLTAGFETRQFMLFRDMDEPDLWLANDGRGTWGEINGSIRDELRGCTDIDLGCSPFTNTLPIRRLELAVGARADVLVAWIDVETLEVSRAMQCYERLDDRRWRFEWAAEDFIVDFETDENGLVVDYPNLFRRVV